MKRKTLSSLKESEVYWKKFFNHIAEDKGDTEEANAYFNKRSFEFTKSALLQAIGNLKGKRIADIGCGTGHATSSLSKNNLLIGVDISLKILAHAREKGLLPVQASATKLPLKSASFEIIICNNLIQIVMEGEKVLDELQRISLKGGKIFIVTANKDGILNKIFSVIERGKYKKMRLYSMQEMISYLDKKGIKVINFYYLSFLLMKVWKNIKSKFIKKISNSFIIEAEKL